MLRFIALIVSVSLIPLSSFPQQKVKLSIYAGSGLSWFGGSGAAKTTTYVVSDSNIPGYVLNPYGSNAVNIFMAGINGELLKKNNWVLSSNIQFEITGAEVNINKAQYRIGIVDTTGVYKKRFNSLSINPEIGKILLQKKINILLNAGIDYTFFLQGHEQYTFYDANGRKSMIIGGSGVPGKNDLRITTALLFTLKNWGLGIHYKQGIRNYQENATEKVFSRIFQARLSYAVWQPTK